MRILIAEDDPISSRILATTLTQFGHEVVTANIRCTVCC
ncbi:MAG TPA: response regulator [Pyrinomonadaceae bacterium]